MDQLNGDISSNGVQIVTTGEGLTTLKGKVNLKPSPSTSVETRQGFEAMVKTINTLIEDSRIANHRRHQDMVQLDTKLNDRLTEEVASIRDGLAQLEAKVDAANNQDEHTRLAEQVDNVVQQVQRLKDVIVKEMRETLSLRGLIETNSDKIAESTQQSNQTQALITKQQSAIDAVQTMQRELQQRAQQAEKQALERSTAANNAATQTRETVESLQQEMAQMRATSERLNAEAADRHAAMSLENQQLKQAVTKVNGRFATLIGLGVFAVLIIVGAIAASRYL